MGFARPYDDENAAPWSLDQLMHFMGSAAGFIPYQLALAGPAIGVLRGIRALKGVKAFKPAVEMAIREGVIGGAQGVGKTASEIRRGEFTPQKAAWEIGGQALLGAAAGGIVGRNQLRRTIDTALNTNRIKVPRVRDTQGAFAELRQQAADQAVFRPKLKADREKADILRRVMGAGDIADAPGLQALLDAAQTATHTPTKPRAALWLPIPGRARPLAANELDRIKRMMGPGPTPVAAPAAVPAAVQASTPMVARAATKAAATTVSGRTPGEEQAVNSGLILIDAPQLTGALRNAWNAWNAYMKAPGSAKYKLTGKLIQEYNAARILEMKHGQKKKMPTIVGLGTFGDLQKQAGKVVDALITKRTKRRGVMQPSLWLSSQPSQDLSSLGGTMPPDKGNF
jgi:hypothetical protein